MYLLYYDIIINQYSFLLGKENGSKSSAKLRYCPINTYFCHKVLTDAFHFKKSTNLII